jgi:ketosteroid isomerase-like protein
LRLLRATKPGTFARLIAAENTDRQARNAKLRLRFAKIRLFEASNNIYQIPVQPPWSPAPTTTPDRPVADFKKFSLERDIMTEHSLWRFSRALHRAINERQREDLEAVIDEDVDWVIYGPIDMFAFLGARHGKAAVLDVIKQIAENVRIRRFERESIMLGAESAASMLRYSLTMLDANKPISLRIAHFAQFRAGRLMRIRILLDTFDLVEQALGQPIHLPRIA